MADYIYLLESRLSQAQQKAIKAVREIARAKGLTVFLVGGAVRDLTSGSPVRDLDVAVQGNALKLKKDLEKAGGVVTGENEASQALYVRFPGSVRMEVGSTLSVHYPKPAKPVVKAATILDDLRRRDFTANAMALSLNEGSYGLLMDPLNGVADIENRELRLVSNYGFIEDPVRMIRAARFAARLGWQMEEKTRARYDTGKEEGYISALSAFHRGYELEEIVHEEDPLRVMRGLEHEGWMKHLSSTWSSAKANVAELEKLREAQMQLQMRGIAADASAAQFPLLTAKLAPKDVSALKKSFPRHGFVVEIEALEGDSKKFAVELSAKQAALPSAAWKLLMSARPEAVLWVAYSSKNAGLQAKFKSFYTDWPQARQKIPYTQMQEMRIVPGVPKFDELVEKVFFELMDGKLGTVEEMKAFLEPYSPPAPPPPVHLRRARATKKDAKVSKTRKKADAANGEEVEVLDEAAALGGAVVAVAGTPAKPAAEKGKAPAAKAVEVKSAPAKPVATKAVVKAPEKKVLAAKVAVKKAAAAKPVAKKTAAKKVVAKPAAKKTPAKKAPAKKPTAKKATPAKGSAKKVASSKPAAKKAVVKTAVVKKGAGHAAKKVAPPAKSSKKPVKSAKRR
jgi:tRNA nucleotidyltransferase (CCA-adding enzyme)